MALLDIALTEFLRSIPSYVWIGLLLMVIGVILLIIPVIGNRIGRASFIVGLLIIAIPSLFLNLWENSEAFRIWTIIIGAFAITLTILFGGDFDRKKR